MSRSRLMPFAAAVAAVLLLPAVASADPPPGTITFVDRDKGGDVLVDGEPVVCAFAIQLDFEGRVEVVGWVIKVWASSAFAGETVLAGDDGPTDADGVLRQPRDGWLTLPDGRYTLLVDDETPVDRSYLAQAFTVDCTIHATPAPTEAPTAAPTATATPTGEVLPTATATATPTGEVVPTATATSTPKGAVLPTEGVATPTPGGEGAVIPTQGVADSTLPPTDTVDASASRGAPVGLIVGILVVLSLAILAITPTHRSRTR